MKKKKKGYGWASYPVFGPYSLSLGLVGQISNHAAHADPPMRCFITDAWAPWRVVSFAPPPTGNRLPYLTAGCARATPPVAPEIPGVRSPDPPFIGCSPRAHLSRPPPGDPRHRERENHEGVRESSPPICAHRRRQGKEGHRL
jgi:hypothetical protein